ncbi:MAG TPA: hypothetical protein VF815_18210 [Myxococcaceae bacterium]|jgi:hypothetical protein
MSLFSASALLLTGLLSAEPEGVRPHAEIRAADIEARFTCSQAPAQSLTVPPGSEVVLQVPAGCPDTGALWLFSLECKARCTGRIADAEGRALASLSGTKAALAVKPLGKEHSRSLGLLQLAVAQKPVRADASDLLDVPLVLRFQAEAFAASHTLQVAEATALGSPAIGSSRQLYARASRVDLGRARIELWSEQQKLLLDTVVKLGAPLPFDCAATAGWCSGHAQLSVEPHQLRQP